MMKEELDKDYLKVVYDTWSYSMQQMDVLVISISGAGIYVVLETLKFSTDHHLETILLLKLSGALFLIGISINFFSQLTSQKGNIARIKAVRRELLYPKPSKNQKKEIKSFEKESQRFSGITATLNKVSTLSMVLGLVSLVWFFLKNF